MKYHIAIIMIVYLCVRSFCYGDTPLYYPPDCGMFSVKDFGAQGDGVTDDTKAIRDAFSFGEHGFTKGKVVYFPKGTYVITDSIMWPTGISTCCIQMRGQGADHTIITLKNNSRGFQSKANPKAMFITKGGNQAFRQSVFDLTLHTGSDNPGAIAFDYISSNVGGIDNVKFISGDGDGYAGLYMARNWPGPLLIKNVSVEGFDYGIFASRHQYGITFEHITLTNQKICALYNKGNSLAIRKLTSINSVPAISMPAKGLITLIDSELKGGSSTNYAVELGSNGHFHARNVISQGYTAFTNLSTETRGDTIEEFFSHSGFRLYENSPMKSLGLRIEETPDYNDSDPENWANALEYPTLQEAFSSGKPVVYFPNPQKANSGNIFIREKIRIPPGVKAVVGFENIFFKDPPKQLIEEPEFIVEGNTEDPLVFKGGITFKHTPIHHLSNRPVVIKHGSKVAYKSYPTSGNLFLEDVAVNLNLEQPHQKIWARQLNSESLHGGLMKLINKGATLWILGMKTEGIGPVFGTYNGGKTEMLGTYVYPVKKFGDVEEENIGFIIDNASASMIFKYSIPKYPILVREIRGIEVREFKAEDFPSDRNHEFIPLYSGYQASSLQSSGTIAEQGKHVGKSVSHAEISSRPAIKPIVSVHAGSALKGLDGYQIYSLDGRRLATGSKEYRALSRSNALLILIKERDD